DEHGVEPGEQLGVQPAHGLGAEPAGVDEQAPPGELHEQAGMDEVTDLHRALPGWVLRCLEHIPARAVCPGPLSPAPAAPVTPLPSWAGRHQGTPDRYAGGVGSGPSAAPSAARARARSTHPSGPHRAAVVPRRAPMPRVVVHVMPQPEILDPQGKAVAAALPRLGFEGIASVRQGKRFELEVEGEVTEQVLASVREAAETLLCHAVIEDDVPIEADGAADGEAQA